MKVVKGGFRLQVTFDADIIRFEIVEGWESRYYMYKNPLPVLEAEIRTKGTFYTEFTKNQA